MKNKRYERKDGGQYVPMQSVEVMNKALTAAEKLVFLYIDLDLEQQDQKPELPVYTPTQ